MRISLIVVLCVFVCFVCCASLSFSFRGLVRDDVSGLLFRTRRALIRLDGGS